VQVKKKKNTHFHTKKKLCVTEHKSDTYPIGGVLPRPLARRFLLGCSTWSWSCVGCDDEAVAEVNEKSKRVSKASSTS